LGTFDGSSYDERTVELAPGDVLVFATDGVTEAYNGREEYGASRLRRQIEEGAGLPAARLGERILADIESFMAGAVSGDDLTLIVVRVL
jgi:sigma-B regulation protein RsbU (phosphoserine phosphatase)